MAYYLGMNLFTHDVTFYLLDENRNLVFGVEEEKIFHVRYHRTASFYALDYMLERAKIDKQEIVAVGLGFSLKKYEKLFDTHRALYGEEIAKRHEAAIRREFDFRYNLIDSMGLTQAEVIEVPHHLAHATSVFALSPFSSAAILSIDGAGENDSVAIFHATEQGIERKAEVLRPHSLGWLWTAVTQWLKLGVQGNEGKTMGLAAYGKPIYKTQFFEGFDTKLGRIPILKVDWETGLFESPAMREIYGRSLTLEDIFGPFQPYEDIPGEYQRDIAATLQDITNDIFLAQARYAREITGEKNLAICGGVAMNSVANGVVERSGIFEQVYVPCNASDNGIGLGSALYAYNQLHEKKQYKVKCKLPYTSCDYTEKEMMEAIKRFDLPVRRCDDVILETAGELSKGKIIGWFQDKLELGARALGNRSILTLPYPLEMKDKVNLKVKFREYWRPFAPVITEEAYGNWFNSEVCRVPYMTSTQPFKPEMGEKVPAVLHKDGTGRVQTCSREDNPKLHALLNEIERHTTIPILLNTSFNIKGMPIVASPEDAILCYLSTDIDILIIGNYMVRKIDHIHDRVSLTRVSHASRFVMKTIHENRTALFVTDGSEQEETQLKEVLAELPKTYSYRTIHCDELVDAPVQQVYLVSCLDDPFSEFDGGLWLKLHKAYPLVEKGAQCFLLNLEGASFVINQLFRKKQWNEIVLAKRDSNARVSQNKIQPLSE